MEPKNEVGTAESADSINDGQKTPLDTSSIYPSPDESHVRKQEIMSGSFVSEAEQAASIRQAKSMLSPADAVSDLPVPVVKVLSVRGVEYVMMSVSLWLVAGSLIWSLISLINGNTAFELLAFPISLMLVCLPVFAFFYLRLRKAELDDPSLRLDASKRRLSQITQILAFLTVLFNLIAFVYIILSKIAGESTVTLWKAALNLLVILAVAGGILVYYWFDEHRNGRGLGQ